MTCGSNSDACQHKICRTVDLIDCTYLVVARVHRARCGDNPGVRMTDIVLWPALGVSQLQIAHNCPHCTEPYRVHPAPCPASCHSIIVTPLLVSADTGHRTGCLRKSFPCCWPCISGLKSLERHRSCCMLRGGMIQQRTNRVIVMEITPSCHNGGLLTPCNVGGSGTYWQMKFYPAQRVGTAPLPSRYN